MDILQPPSVTAFDAAASTLSLLVYLGVALGALAHARRDIRARVFAVVTLASAVPYVLSPLQWRMGAGVYTPPVIALTTVAFGIGSAALFHFTQVFPARRPWIRAHWPWLAAAYVVPAIPLALVAWVLSGVLAAAQAIDQSGSGGIGAVSVGVTSLVLLLALPAIFVVALALPFSGVMSLFKSWQEAKQAGDEPARLTTFWMLVSQLAGGVLAVLVLPLLHLVGVGAAWGIPIAALTYAFALLFPLTFALAVWRYRMLSTSAG